MSETAQAAEAAETTADCAESAVEDETMIMHGMIIYADGGAKPNPGPAGWGIHGYLYSDRKPVRGSGNSGWLLTQAGYVRKTARDGSAPEVTPVHYVDGYGSIPADQGKKPTNNMSELLAATKALEHALDYGVQRVLVTTDSEHVREGMEGWVETWQKNGWLRSNGKPVLNSELWKALIAVRQRLRDRGVEVRFARVKGHSGHIGNEMADKHATIGVILSQQNILRSEITTSPAQGYWKYDSERHPMLANRRMYFNTLAPCHRSGEYYLGEHGTEDDLLGKRISDGVHTVVRLREPDAALELVRNYTTELAAGMDTIVMVRVDQLFSADTHREIMTFGSTAMPRANPYRLDLNCLDEEPGPDHRHKPLTRELRTPRLAMRAIDAISDLIDKLDMYQANDPLITATDLTDVLYETRDKVVGRKRDTISVTELKAQYGVGYAALEVMANYRVVPTTRHGTAPGSAPASTPAVAQAPVTLTLGIDLLNRNSLKRLEKHRPRITLITWLESSQVFRYASVIEADGDVMIMAAVYSNLRLVF